MGARTKIGGGRRHGRAQHAGRRGAKILQSFEGGLAIVERDHDHPNR
jgi:hypothetical protein